jgi:murein DD-endopeptidase MepM/ murein hydrolase activator NlpD
MINKYALLVILVLFSYQLNANEISGTSGDVIAVMTDEGEVNALSYKYNQSEYLILGLPYVYQTSVKKIGDIDVEVRYKNFGESRITIKDLSKVDLNQEDRERANAEALLIKAALQSYDKTISPSFNFKNPVIGIISSRYGKKRYINEKPRSPHLALDIAANLGVAVSAPLKGRVILTGNFFYTGNTIILDHGFGLISSYSHLDSSIVKENEMIQQGELIGTVGETGRVTGPHLHWTVYLNKEKINPEALLKENFLQNLFKASQDIL